MAHSVRHELERCLESIERHAGMPVQTVLVDNASTDGTVEWVRDAYPDVEVVPLDRNIGLAARQPGIELARGELAMFLDSDAVLLEGALPAMVEAMRAHPDWGLIGPRLVYDDGSLQLSCRRFPPPLLPWLRRPPLARLFDDSRLVRRHLMADDGHSRAREVVYVLGACQLFRTSLARAAGPLADYFFWPDDADWCIRIRDAGGRVVYFPQAAVVHSYRRMTSRSPLSRAAIRHLWGFYAFQWKYRRRRRELERLGDRLDREAASFDAGTRDAGGHVEGAVYPPGAPREPRAAR